MVYASPTPLELSARRRMMNGLGGIRTEREGVEDENDDGLRPHSTKSRKSKVIDEPDRPTYSLHRPLSSTAATREGRSHFFFPETPDTKLSESEPISSRVRVRSHSTSSKLRRHLEESKSELHLESSSVSKPEGRRIYPESSSISQRPSRSSSVPKFRVGRLDDLSVDDEDTDIWRSDSKIHTADLRDEIAEGRTTHSILNRQPRDLSEELDDHYPASGRPSGSLALGTEKDRTTIFSSHRRGINDDRLNQRLYIPKLSGAESDLESITDRRMTRFNGTADSRINAMLERLGEAANKHSHHAPETTSSGDPDVQRMRNKYEKRMDTMRQDYEDQMIATLGRVESTFEREIHAMEEKLDQANTDREEAVVQASRLKVDFEDRLRSKETLIVETFQRELEAMERQLEEFEAKKAEELTKARKEHNETIFTLRKDVEDALKSKKEFAEKVDQEIAMIQKQFLEDMDNIKTEAVKKERTKWKEEISELVKETTETIEFMRQKHSTEIANLESSLEDERSFASKIESELQSLRSKSMNEELNYQQNLRMLEDELNSLKRDAKQKELWYKEREENNRQELKAAVRERDSYMEEVSVVRKDHTNLRKDLDKASEELVSRGGTIAHLQRDLKSVESYVKEMEREIRDSKLKLERQVTRNRDNEKEMLMYRDRINSLEKKERAAVDSKFTALESELMKLKVERDSGLRRIASLEDSIEKYRREAESERSKGKLALKKASASHSEEIASMQKQLAHSSSSLDEIQGLVGVLKDDCDREVGELKKELDAAKHREEQLEDFIKHRLNAYERENMQYR